MFFIFGLTNLVFVLTIVVFVPTILMFGLTNLVFGLTNFIFGPTILSFVLTGSVFVLTFSDFLTPKINLVGTNLKKERTNQALEVTKPGKITSKNNPIPPLGPAVSSNGENVPPCPRSGHSRCDVHPTSPSPRPSGETPVGTLALRRPPVYGGARLPASRAATRQHCAVRLPPSTINHTLSTTPSPIQRTPHPQPRLRHHMRINLRRAHILVPE